jgi:hypothetical protein
MEVLMTEKDIVDNNGIVSKGLVVIDKKISILEREKRELLAKIKAPCVYCPLDGEFRCIACSEENYTGFNNKDWF